MVRSQFPWRSRFAVTGLVILSLLTVVFCASSCGTPSFSSETVNKIDGIVTGVMKDHKVPGAIVGVWEEGKGEYVKAYGEADMSKGRKMTTTDLFKAASNTKTITGTLILELVDQGKLSLDDTLSKFDFARGVKNADKITIRMLLNHTSGLADPSNESEAMKAVVGEDPKHEFTVEEVMTFGSRMPVLSEPGTKYHYSNWNFYMLGHIVELVTGKKLAAQMQAEFFDKLGMPNTRLDPQASFLLAHPHSNGYIWDPSGKYIEATDWSTSWTWAAGSVVTDISDFKKWVEAVANGTFLTPEMRKERLANGADAGSGSQYLLGVKKTGNVYNHSGAVAGYSSYGGSDPDRKLTVCVFMNAMPAADSEGRMEWMYGAPEMTANEIFKAMGESLPGQ